MKRDAPFATCSNDSEPLISSLEVAYKEWLCMVCGNRFEYFAPRPAKPTPELQERYDELHEKYITGERP